jgi:signal peptidase I
MIHAPQRGDVVVFRATAAGSPDRDFIKRVIGLPGETVQVRANHHVYINGHMLQEPYQLIAPNYTWGPKKVPPNDYFVLGDHRSNSDDSHLWPSTWLQRQDIIGKAWVAYWPPKDAELIQASPHVATGR